MTPQHIEDIRQARQALKGLPIVIDVFDDADPPDEEMLAFIVSLSSIWDDIPAPKGRPASIPGMHKGISLNPVRRDGDVCAYEMHVSPTVYARIQAAQPKEGELIKVAGHEVTAHQVHIRKPLS